MGFMMRVFGVLLLTLIIFWSLEIKMREKKVAKRNEMSLKENMLNFLVKT